MQRHWTPEELAEQWTLFPRERVLLANKSGPTRLGFAVLLKYFQCEARFPVHSHEVPSAVVAYLAQQVGVAAEVWPQYNWNGRAIKYHRAQIRQHLGFREATSADGQALSTWLGEQILATTHRLEHLREAVYQRCRNLQIEPPTSDRIDRLINAAVQTFEARLCDHVLTRLSLTTRQQLDALLEPIETPISDHDGAAPFGAGRTLLHELRADPGRATLDNLFREIVKLEHVRALALPSDLVDAVSPNVLQTYGQRAAVEAPYELRRHPEPLRMTLLAVFAHLRSRELTDTLVDLFLELVHRIGARAERKVEKELLEDLKRVHGKTGMLYRLAEATLDHPNDVVKEVVFPVVSEATLRDLVKEWKSTGPLYRDHVRTVIRSSYRSHYRRMLPRLLQMLEFRSNNATHHPLIDALGLLKTYLQSRLRTYPVDEEVPLDGVVRDLWWETVVETDAQGCPRVNRISYEICVLQALRERLRCKEMWVVGADHYRNPDEDLPTDFVVQRPVERNGPASRGRSPS